MANLSGCGKPIVISVPTRHSHKLIESACGAISYYGYPDYCDDCSADNLLNDINEKDEVGYEQK